MKCKLNGTEIESLYPCSSNCPLFGDCVVQHEKESEKRKYQTNADRILAMSGKELKAWYCKNRDCGTCDFCRPFGCTFEYWLQQPAEEDSHE